MPSIKLGASWSRLLRRYEDDHRHPVNRACHTVGVPLIAASIPTAATLVGLPVAAGLFAVGWTFQLVGHAFEGRKPSFVDDRRALLVGLLWWLKKVRLLRIEETAPDA